MSLESRRSFLAPIDTSLRRAVLLDVAGLSTIHARADDGKDAPRVVDDVSFRVYPGETLSLLGESGCGKTTAVLSVLGLLPRGARVVAGEIRFKGQDLRKLSASEMRRVLGAEIGVVFQDPLAALDPVMTIGAQLLEVLRLEEGLTRSLARRRALDLLARVGLPDPRRIAREHPHRLSGGMRQRAMIAIAIARNPSLLVADEPTSALDATVQKEILELFRSLQDEIGMGILLITHDLAVVAENAHRAEVMYAGRIVESAPVAELLLRPRHPYTALLLRSHPSRATGSQRLEAIPGRVPAPTERPSGCRFRDRCPIAKPKCAESEPTLIPLGVSGGVIGGEHSVACHYDEEASRL